MKKHEEQEIERKQELEQQKLDVSKSSKNKKLNIIKNFRSTTKRRNFLQFEEQQIKSKQEQDNLQNLIENGVAANFQMCCCC